MPLSIKGINVAVLFVEKEGFIKLSFRSKGSFSVNDFAARFFNGGGHRNAAGGQYDESLEKAIDHFEKSIAEFAESDNSNNK
jgi:phosphoesterase RecJ-like protein